MVDSWKKGRGGVRVDGRGPQSFDPGEVEWGEELSLELGDKDPVPLPGEQRAICTPQLERVERAHTQAHFGGRSGDIHTQA